VRQPVFFVGFHFLHEFDYCSLFMQRLHLSGPNPRVVSPHPTSAEHSARTVFLSTITALLLLGACAFCSCRLSLFTASFVESTTGGCVSRSHICWRPACFDSVSHRLVHREHNSTVFGSLAFWLQSCVNGAQELASTTNLGLRC
jgi:hypothetical protein